MEGSEGDAFYLSLVEDLIGAVQADLGRVDEQQFLSDRNLADLTAYRLSTIGEYTNCLSAELKARHSNIPWPAIYRMRNIIAHHYHLVRRERVWAAAAFDLDTSLEACRAELVRLGR